MILYIDRAIDGIEYDFSFERSVDESLFDGRQIESCSTMKVSGKYSVVKNVVYVKGIVTIDKIILPCDRCLTNVETSVSTDLDAVFTKDGAEGTYQYEGWQPDITDAVTESIQFALPSTVLCREDCLGLCPSCGKNLNEEKCNCKTQQERYNAFSVLLEE